MIGKKLKLVATLLLAAVTLLALVPSSFVRADEVQSPSRQQAGTNLLVNPGFEGIGRAIDNSTPNEGNWTRDTFTGAQYGEIFTPEGWVTWWEEGEFKRPECKVIPNEHPFNADPDRIYDGYYSGMCFTFFGKQNAGYYQVVRNIPAGSQVEASFHAHAWSCGEDGDAYSCGDPYSFYFRVGIDPNGGTDPFSSSIVWSSPYYYYDTFGRVGPVQATVGGASAATIFVQAYGKWAIKHNDAYIDNVSLTMLTPAETPTPTLEPPPPTPETPPTPQFTPTANPAGSIVHEVVAGDTVFGLALAYGVDPQQIYDLNNLTSESLLSIGQELVISTTGEAVPTPTPTVAPVEEEQPAEAQPTAEPGGAVDNPDPGAGGVPAAPAEGKASVCVLGFYDANSDGFRQADEAEMMLPNAQINLLAQSGPVDSRTTDGISEPWCFRDLDPGNYILRHTAPPGYSLTDGGQWNFILSSGQVLNLELAYAREGGSGSQAAPDESNPDATTDTPTSEPEGEEGGSGVTNVLNIVLRVSGFIVLALAIAVLVLFVLSRRSA
ncbi:MAG: LysM peptidoglycan-binding domain-containing protein [Anaerolineae bacterium]|nr:LysM peptidoglycan-binding domain-containing protein [Anaerolineae bacterium]